MRDKLSFMSSDKASNSLDENDDKNLEEDP